MKKEKRTPEETLEFSKQRTSHDVDPVRKVLDERTDREAEGLVRPVLLCEEGEIRRRRRDEKKRRLSVFLAGGARL